MLVALAVFGSRAVRPGRPARVAAAVAQPVAIAAAVDAAVAVPPTMTVLVGTPHAYVPLGHPLSCAIQALPPSASTRPVPRRMPLPARSVTVMSLP